MKKHIILARYKEDMQWLNRNNQHFDTIYLFDKDGVPEINPNKKIVYELLPNIGREAHTYLHFIVKYYDELVDDDVYIFSQANPSDSNPGFFRRCANLNPKSEFPVYMGSHFGEEETKPHMGNVVEIVHPMGMPTIHYIHHLFYNADIIDKHTVFLNAFWAQTGKNIKFRKKEFYQHCLDMFDDKMNPMEAYVFERLWQYIFNTKYLDWISHYKQIRDIYGYGTYKGNKIT